MVTTIFHPAHIRNRPIRHFIHVERPHALPMLQLESLIDRLVVDLVRLHKIGRKIYKGGSISAKKAKH
jgi:hypothetical protein